MRILLALLLTGLSAVAAPKIHQGDTITITLANGKTYTNGKITVLCDEGIALGFEDGGDVCIDYSEMTPADQKAFHYDPIKAAAYKNQVNQKIEAAIERQHGMQPDPDPEDWQTLTTVTGDGERNSDQFYILSGRWRIVWFTTPTSTLPKMSYFSAEAKSDDGAESVDICSSDSDDGADRSEARGVGHWYLHVNSANCKWRILVQQFSPGHGSAPDVKPTSRGEPYNAGGKEPADNGLVIPEWISH